MLSEFEELCNKKSYSIGELTVGQIVEMAEELEISAGKAVIIEAALENEISIEEVEKNIISTFDYNLSAVEIGVEDGHSLLMGTVGKELMQFEPGEAIIGDEFIDRAIVYTLGAQVGNHTCGLQPCAGTGDSCVYSGLVRAIFENYEDEDKIVKALAVLLKVGSIFRVGKTTTGCNMEGFGAGSAATAAALVELKEGKPSELERAIVLAISPTIANPCTPRVMVAGLCASHIGGAIVVGNLAAGLAVNSSLPVEVPVDVMMAMAAEVHPLSAKHIVPEVIKYMEPYFKKKEEVENLVDEDIRQEEMNRMKETQIEAERKAAELAAKSRSIINPFGEAVVGGSSQAVGSPTNAGRIVHEIAEGEIKKVKIELYPELFARRGINIPGILMGAVYGASTSDSKSYKEVLAKVENDGIDVEIVEADIPQLQRITLKTKKGKSVVDSLNRGGARVVIRDAIPSKKAAVDAAKNLGIDVVQE